MESNRQTPNDVQSSPLPVALRFWIRPSFLWAYGVVDNHNNLNRWHE